MDLSRSSPYEGDSNDDYLMSLSDSQFSDSLDCFFQSFENPSCSLFFPVLPEDTVRSTECGADAVGEVPQPVSTAQTQNCVQQDVMLKTTDTQANGCENSSSIPCETASLSLANVYQGRLKDLQQVFTPRSVTAPFSVGSAYQPSYGSGQATSGQARWVIAMNPNHVSSSLESAGPVLALSSCTYPSNARTNNSLAETRNTPIISEAQSKPSSKLFDTGQPSKAPKTRKRGRCGSASAVSRSTVAPAQKQVSHTVTSDPDTKLQECPVSEDDTELDKRRNERNLREQMRSQRVTEQIKDLRDLLKSSNIQFKPDKFTTLVTVDNYIRYLRERALTLDEERKKVFETIARTGDFVNSQFLPKPEDTRSDPLLFDPSKNDHPAADVHISSSDSRVKRDDPTSQSTDDESRGFIMGINYKYIFDCCPFACSVTSIDGRFLDCNLEFLELTGFDRQELMPQKKAHFHCLSVNQYHDEGANSINEATTTPSIDASGDIWYDQMDSRPSSPGIITTNKECTSESFPINKSLFNVLHKENIENLFCAMSEMLKFRDDASDEPYDEYDTWSDKVKLCRKENAMVTMRVTLVRSSNGLPQFFNCVMFHNT